MLCLCVRGERARGANQVVSAEKPQEERGREKKELIRVGYEGPTQRSKGVEGGWGRTEGYQDSERELKASDKKERVVDERKTKIREDRDKK